MSVAFFHTVRLCMNLYFCAMQKVIAFMLVLMLGVSCQEKAIPKPMGELRLEYPKPHYQLFSEACAYQFEYSNFGKIIISDKKPCWYYLVYPEMKAKVFITYYPVAQNLDEHIMESEKMVYGHTVKASAIETKSFSYPEKRVYGNFYELKGHTASNIQFYATDSTRHFVTAYLYFNSRPKPDSLAPAVDYIKKDLLHLIDTFHWK